jgi:hypothetical protein
MYEGIMPHTIVLDGSSIPLDDVVDLGRHGGGSRVRFERVSSGDAVVIAPAGGRLDGSPMLGGIALIEWGVGALVRVPGLRIEVRWSAAVERRSAPTGMRCSLCFGAVVPGEGVSLCRCEAPLHEECTAVMISCPGCGAPHEVGPVGNGPPEESV